MNRLRLNRPGLLVVALLVAHSVSAEAQERLQFVHGIVRDTSGVPLGGAEVLLRQHRRVTSPTGEFRVDSLRPGKYPLTIRLLGYRPVRTQIAVVEAEPTELEYYLVGTPVLLPAVAVSVPRVGIYGVVGDTGYRKAVGAKVQLLGTSNYTALTDSLGKFAFPGAERGQYIVRVTFGGYSERRIPVELKKGEGRELVVLLSPSTERPPPGEDAAMLDLGQRIAAGLRRERLIGSDLTRRGATTICELPQLKSEIGTNAETTLILNGTTIYREWPMSSLCSWDVDEVEMVEFGRDACAEVTHTVAERLGVFCSARARNVPRSIDPRGSTRPASRSYVIIWEKK